MLKNIYFYLLIFSVGWPSIANAWPPTSSLKPSQPTLRVTLVRKGENLKDIAGRCQTTVKNLILHNKLNPPYRIFINQPLEYEIISSSEKNIPIEKRAERLPEKKKDNSYSSLYDFERDTEELGIVLPLVKPKNIKTLRLRRTADYFSWPLKGKVLSNFGKKRFGLVNDGINIAATYHQPVMAAEDGVVVYAGNGIKGFGNLILLKHAQQWTTAYAHNDILLVETGQHVKRGETISKAGKTGHVDKVQLHFEIRKSGVPVNPVKHLK